MTINDKHSNTVQMLYGVPQGSVLGPLLFLIYINDLHRAITYSTVRHFADDTNLLINHVSPKKLQRYLNLDLRFLCRWLKANLISLNSSKTELIIFKHPNKKINYNFKIMIDGKKLIPSKFVKYLGILIDCNLNWSYHIDVLATKLSRANGMLSKIRHYVSGDTLRSIYFGIFHSLLTYGSQIWGQIRNRHFHRLQTLQNKAIRIINFANYRATVNPLYKNSNILNLTDTINLQNFLLVRDCIKGELPDALSNTFQLVRHTHSYNTRSSLQNKVTIPAVRTTIYGIRSIKYQSCQIWNFLISKHRGDEMNKKSKSECKKIIRNYYLQLYE